MRTRQRLDTHYVRITLLYFLCVILASKNYTYKRKKIDEVNMLTRVCVLCTCGSNPPLKSPAARPVGSFSGVTKRLA